MKRFDYFLENELLTIREVSSGNIVQCNAFEAPVLQVLPLSRVEGCLVLLDPSAIKKPTFENLFKVSPDGLVDWTVSLPLSHDAFVSVIDRGDYVEARTWKGQSVEINLANGQTRNVRFVK